MRRLIEHSRTIQSRTGYNFRLLLHDPQPVQPAFRQLFPFIAPIAEARAAPRALCSYYKYITAVRAGAPFESPGIDVSERAQFPSRKASPGARERNSDRARSLRAVCTRARAFRKREQLLRALQAASTHAGPLRCLMRFTSGPRERASFNEFHAAPALSYL